MKREQKASIMNPVEQRERRKLALFCCFLRAYLTPGFSQRRVPVTVLRTPEESPQWMAQQLMLTPRRGWGGRGLLGCHLIPES